MFISKLMNGGDFDLMYCLAGAAGIFLLKGPIDHAMNAAIDPEIIALARLNLGVRVASALIGCIVYDVGRRFFYLAVNLASRENDVARTPGASRLDRVKKRGAGSDVFAPAARSAELSPFAAAAQARSRSRRGGFGQR
ncbi:MAG: hypothetical protein KGL46_12945 [Hyphomicrobiales bacterium]|nr:hypothetical protein [Hyphomicrobiales bacterium]